MTYRCRPISLNAVRKWIAETHRHLRRPITGWLFGVEILKDGERVGVACAGRPAARMLQDGETCEVTRVAVREGYKNACSFAYGALRKAAVALGYTRVVTYTLDGEEPGSSLRAAGFVDCGVAGGGEADRPSRRRKPVEQAGRKRRWEWCAAGKAAEAAEGHTLECSVRRGNLECSCGFTAWLLGQRGDAEAAEGRE